MQDDQTHVLMLLLNSTLKIEQKRTALSRSISVLKSHNMADFSSIPRRHEKNLNLLTNFA